MPAYLKFYDLESSPFDADSESRVVLGTKALRDALAAVRSGLEEGAARICVNGQAGMGKTSLARALPQLLDEGARVATILHPSTSWNSIRSSIAKQWKLGEGGLARSNLLSFAQQTRLVLVVDQAESASTDILDHIDVLLSYRTEDDRPVVQSVLFANLTANANGDPAPLLWWLDRIQTLQLQFAPLPREGVGSYIQKHLKRAGWKRDSLFDNDAAFAIHGYTSGIPREVDRVCETLLTEAANRNLRSIDASFVHELLDDQVEEDSSTYDTFEELVMEDEFVGADQTEDSETESPPSLQETLERFAETETERTTADESEAPVQADDTEAPEAESAFERETEPQIHDTADPSILSAETGSSEGEASTIDPVTSEAAPASVLELVDRVDEIEETAEISALAELEASLSMPPSPEELRAIARQDRRRMARIAAAIFAMLMLGGIIVSSWSGQDDPKAAAAPKDEVLTTVPDQLPAASSPTLFAEPGGLTPLDSPEPVLARLRGPVVVDDPGVENEEGTRVAPPASPGHFVPDRESDAATDPSTQR